MGQVKQKINFVFFLLVLMMPSISFSSEIDSITDRCEALPDLTTHLNIIISDGLNKVVKKANRKAKKRYLRRSYPFRKKKGEDYCNPDDCDCKLPDNNQVRILSTKYGKYAEIFINTDGPGVRDEKLKAGILLKALLTNFQ